MGGHKLTANSNFANGGAVPAPNEDVLDLGEVTAIAAGTYRDVYPFPGRDDLVVKVLRTGAEWQPGRPIRNFLKARSLCQRYRFMFREYESYLEAKLKQIEIGAPLPIAELLWLQQTTLGLGMIVEKARGKDGQNARSLGTLRRENAIETDVLNALNAWIALTEEYDIVANDTNPENLMFDEACQTPRFVLVDGFGDPNPIQLKRLSRLARKRARDRRHLRTATFLGLKWNSDKFKIER